MADYCKHTTGYELVKVEIHGGSWQLRKQCSACGELFHSAVSQRGYRMDRVPEYQPPVEPEQLGLFGK